MRRIWPIYALILMAAVASADVELPVPSPASGPPRDEVRNIVSQDEASQMYGVDFAEQLRALSLQDHVLPQAVISGMKEGLAGRKRTDNEMIQRSQAFLLSWKQPKEGDPSASRADAPSAEEASMIYGINFGENLRRAGIQDHVSVPAIEQGFNAGLAGNRTLSQQDREQLRGYLKTVVASIAKRNLNEAEDFLAKNRRKKGVKTFASGLQYKIVKLGDGHAASPKASDQVLVEYRGTLLDGTLFDDSRLRGQPLKIRINDTIKGWQEALQHMKPGSKWQLFVPPDLAYGLTSRPGIPAGSLLIFEVALLGDGTSVGTAGAAPVVTQPSRNQSHS